ncbi:MAG: hypothetical protein EB140_13095, partial [Proteobacteria bacterium]|nr:hypothetical protein [Pseudomonadota bacterium]
MKRALSIRVATITILGLVVISVTLTFGPLGQLGGDRPAEWSILGNADDRIPGLQTPWAIACDSDGTTLIVDRDRAQVIRVDPEGHTVARWGRVGSGPGEFNRPTGIATDVNRRVYVVDSGNDRVQVFSASGAPIAEWGRRGSDPGEFDVPYGIAIWRGTALVTDRENNRIQTFDLNGQFLNAFGHRGPDNLGLDRPTGIAVDPHGITYVADTGNARVRVFDPPDRQGIGHLIDDWGRSSDEDTMSPAPMGLAIARDATVFISDEVTADVTARDPTGRVTGRWVRGPKLPDLRNPIGIGFDRNGSLIVADRGARQVHVLGQDGSPKASWGRAHSGPGQFVGPIGVAFDPVGNVLVAEFGANRIRKLSPTGAPIAEFGRRGIGPGEFDGPYGIAVDSKGRILVSDRDNSRLQWFEADG